IGLLFFIFILCIESLLFFVLYTNLANDRIDEVLNSLLARGNTHRDVLEKHFDQTTLEHVGIMESASEFTVVITNEENKIIISSNHVEDSMLNIVDHAHNDEVPKTGKIIEGKWNKGAYVATESPITIDGEHKGHVFMFAETNFVKKTINQLSNQFLVVSIFTIILTIITIFILSKFVAHPLIKMKEATKQLSKGKNHMNLHTERKDELGELANSITTLSKELKELKMSRSEFLASVSHELRTPLTYIKGYADIINRQGMSRDEIEEYTQIIQEETVQLTSLVQNLFQLAKIDQNQFQINRENGRLSDFFKKIVEHKHTLVTDQQLTVDVRCTQSTVAFLDSERFQQVFMNIIDNAQKYSDEGTKILIHVKQTDQNTIMTTIDEGIGIPAQEIPYIFDRLYRVEKSHSRWSGCCGLGMAITKEIVESHGGSIEVESRLEEGTAVIIKLPRRDWDE